MLMIVFSFGYYYSLGQSMVDTTEWRQRIFADIKDKDIEYYYLGSLAHISKTRQKADSLFKNAGIDITLKYINEKSYSVKYYAFIRLLELSDSLAFNYLTLNITDSTLVWKIGGCMSWANKFNELIASEYKTFVSYKYKGQSFSVDHRAYIFTERNRKLEKKKLKEFNKLIGDNKLNLKNI